MIARCFFIGGDMNREQAQAHLESQWSKMDRSIMLSLMQVWADIILSHHSKCEPMYTNLKNDLITAKKHEHINNGDWTSQRYANFFYQSGSDWLRLSKADNYNFCMDNYSDFDIACRLSVLISYIRRGCSDGFVDSGLIFWAFSRMNLDK